MRHLGFCLLALLLPATAAALTVDRAVVRISPSRTDRVRLAGRLQGVEVEGATQIRLAVDGVGFTLDLADFTRQRVDARRVVRAPSSGAVVSRPVRPADAEIGVGSGLIFPGTPC